MTSDATFLASVLAVPAKVKSTRWPSRRRFPSLRSTRSWVSASLLSRSSRAAGVRSAS